MKALRRLKAKLIGLLSQTRRVQAAQEFDEEMKSHLAMHVEDNIRSGMSPEQAHREAILKLGGIEVTRQARREGATVVALESLWQDIRFAMRQMKKNPGFAFTAILILSLGICANVAIFSFVDAVLIKPLPYQDPTRLVGLFESTPLGSQLHLSYLDYLDWKRLNKVFASVEAYDNNSSLLNTPTGEIPTNGAIVSDGFFRTLGIAPVLGRDFHSAEDLASAPRTVILSYAAWQSRYGGRPDALGQVVTLDGTPNVIIGVLPRDFYFAPVGPAEFWKTLHLSSNSDRGDHGLLAIGRLKDGVSLETAQADMSSIAQQLAKQYPDADGGRGATLVALTDVIVGNLRPILLLLLSGAALLLLIACVNVSSLLLVRTESRRREIAVRGALGASRARLIRQFVTEGLALVAAGSLIGVTAAYWTMQLLTRLIPTNMMANMPYLHQLGLNKHLFLFTAAIALLAALLFSLTPIVRLSLTNLRDGLTEGGRGTAGTIWRRLGANLVVVELCTAMVLLVGAGLLGKSFYRLMHTDIGLQPDHLVGLRLQATRSGYANIGQVAAMAKQVTQEVGRLPGVQSVAISQGLPVGDGYGNGTTFEVIGRPGHEENNAANTKTVSAGYFRTIQARLLRGRYFTEEEDSSKPLVMIVNQSFARKYFPNEDPLGKQIRFDASEPPIKIVGVTDDIKEGPLDAEAHPELYIPFDQDPHYAFYVIARTSQEPQALLTTLSETIHQIAPAVLISDGVTMVDRINQSQASYLHRSSAWLVGGFAALAFLLGVVGLYGVVAYSVSQRTREIGVRMALGAQRASVYQLILKEAGFLVAAGVILGLICSLAATRLMGKLLFAVSAWDIPTLTAVALTLGTSAMLASYLPARRAASVNPTEALRAE
jgi:macrolide transport system ATP-binding/permease protein